MILTLTLAPGVVLTLDPSKVGIQISLDDDTAGVIAQTNANAAETLSLTKELRTMAQVSDQVLADLQAAAQANAARDAEQSTKIDALIGKADAAAQLITDLKAALAANAANSDAAVQAVTALLNTATAQDVASGAQIDVVAGKLDAAVAP